MNEKDSHKAAFEAYYALGAARSLTALAEQTGISRSTLRNWSSAYRWQDRLEERAHEVARAVAARSVRTEVKDRLQQRQLVELGLVTLARQIAEGKVRGTLADLDRLIRLERFLEGEADSRQEVIARELKGKSPDELREMLRRELADLAALSGEAEVVPALPRGVAEVVTEPAESAIEEVEMATETPRRDEAEETS
ncbi:MAG: hypothetical protein U0167_15225 [bacterium]